MWKKNSPEKAPEQMHKFSTLYQIQKVEILQKGNKYLDEIECEIQHKNQWECKRMVEASKFIEFLSWIEKVNQWAKKEEWKQIIDDWLNKYEAKDILYAFRVFEGIRGDDSLDSFKIKLDKAKTNIRIEIMWDSISKRVFGYYWNYLKLLKSKSLEKKAQEAMGEVREDTLQKLEKLLETRAVTYERLLDQEVEIREAEMKNKLKLFDESDKLCDNLTWEIKDKRDELYRRTRGNVDKKMVDEIRVKVDELKKKYEERISLSKEIHKLIDKRNQYVEKLERAIEIVNDFPWVETEWMQKIMERIGVFDRKNESLLENIETTNRILNILSGDDGQLSFDF